MMQEQEQTLSLSSQNIKELLEAVLAQNAAFRFEAKGYSMSPFIKDADILLISPLNNTRPSIGDVVAFSNPPRQPLVVHRVVGRRNNAFFIKGDTSFAGEGDMVDEGNIIGRVTAIKRCGKIVGGGLGTRKALIAFLSRCGIWALIYILWTRIRPKKSA